MLRRRYVFAEEGLDVVLARMGLLPPEAGEGAEEMDLEEGDEPDPDWDVWEALEPVAAPERRELPGGRWFASFRHKDVEAIVLAAEEPFVVMFVGTAVDQQDVERALAEAGLVAPGGLGVSAYMLRPGKPIASSGQRGTLAEIREDLGRHSELGEWEEVPARVARDLASTAAWVSARRGS